jgi:hypothetical protein
MYPFSQVRTAQVLLLHWAVWTSSPVPPHTVSQTLPHPPQLLVSVAVLTSQPFAGFPSQSAKPGLHAATVQALLEHPAVPFAMTHVWPQAPQSFGSFWVLISQPLAGLWSQSEYPALQDATVQLPPVQPATPFCSLQTWPQPPQSFTVVPVLTSQPLAGLPSQSAKPGLHDPTVHAPAAHPADPLATEQTRPQEPQSPGLVFVLTSQPLAGLPSQSA